MLRDSKITNQMTFQDTVPFEDVRGIIHDPPPGRNVVAVCLKDIHLILKLNLDLRMIVGTMRLSLLVG